MGGEPEEILKKRRVKVYFGFESVIKLRDYQ